VISGLATDNNDPLSRRDQGLEFLDVTSQAHVERISSVCQGGRQTDTYRITNASSSVIDTHLLIIVKGLADRGRLENASGATSGGDPYIRVFLHDGVLNSGNSIELVLVLRRPHGNNASPGGYTLNLLSGQGQP